LSIHFLTHNFPPAFTPNAANLALRDYRGRCLVDSRIRADMSDDLARLVFQISALLLVGSAIFLLGYESHRKERWPHSLLEVRCTSR
jgi:hypothetical protein